MTGNEEDISKESIPGEGTQELFEHYKYVVDKGQLPMRIDKYLFGIVRNTTRTRIQYSAEAGCILVNGKPAKSSYKTKPGDVISFVLATPHKEINILPENIPLNIVYEDDELLVINKKPQMVVHPAYGNFTGTMVNALLYYLNGKDASLKGSLDDEKSVRPGLVHRLDKDTSGLILVAKNEIALARLAKDMFDRKITRRYNALIWGEPKEREGTINVNIGRSMSDRKKMAAFPEGNHGKHAITHYKLLESLGYVSLVECKLETGRTHQIRVHMRYMGNTVFNDAEYGGDQVLRSATSAKYKGMVEKCFQLCPRQALHAKYISFTHPASGKLMEFESELPEDILNVIEAFRKHRKS